MLCNHIFAVGAGRPLLAAAVALALSWEGVAAPPPAPPPEVSQGPRPVARHTTRPRQSLQ